MGRTPAQSEGRDSVSPQIPHKVKPYEELNEMLITCSLLPL